MIKFLLLFLIAFPAFANVRLELKLRSSQVKQGEMVDAILKIDISSLQLLEVQKLKGMTFNKALYFYSVSAPLRNEGSQDYKSDVKVIFINPPESQVLVENINGRSVQIMIGEVVVTPTEAPKSYIYGEFTVPERTRLFLYSAIALVLLLGSAVLGMTYFKKRKRKLEARMKKLALKQEVLGCKTYQDVVELWKRKHDHLEIFPHIKDAFIKLETVLNKYQFKPSQTRAEMEEVMSSYNQFLKEIEGGFIGI